MNFKGSATGSALAAGAGGFGSKSPLGSGGGGNITRNSRYGAVTSCWNGSEQNDATNGGVVLFEQSEGEDFLVGSAYSKQISANNNIPNNL